MASFILKTLVVLALFSQVSSPAAYADELWNQHPAWSGSWDATPQLDKLFGIKRKMGEQKHPESIEFEFLLDKRTAGKFMGNETMKSVEQRFAKMKQIIFAAGRWKVNSEFKGFSSRDSMLFVTKKDGVTFLWIGTPSKSFMDAEVHYIRGKTPNDDLLILDFGMSNSIEKRLRQFSGNAVGYKPHSKGE